ncbi:MAG: hypothetical protein QF890_03285 [Myxococcota bacterium]|nr:hypothetical protein [Deltaproteobacteria bacterium]MCP4244798.1 hypothetical protein [bacterium]MDP6074215.1 hypothetical protein [Myxococcota bacterium]MDP6242729.1 hypothetical protein [Myxococcota bacterium]MDP7075811.1 hypothetical protein [Myxococcota bacterium]
MSAEDLVETSIASVGSSNESPARISASRCTSREFAELERARVWQLACSPNPGCEPCDRGWPGFWPRYAALWSEESDLSADPHATRRRRGIRAGPLNLESTQT